MTGKVQDFFLCSLLLCNISAVQDGVTDLHQTYYRQVKPESGVHTP